MMVPRFIDVILKDIALKKKLKNIEINHKKGCDDGTGFISIISRAIITGIDENNAPNSMSFICKFEPSKELRDKSQSSQLFEREVFMYSKVLKEFHKMQEEYKIPKEEFVTYPECYYANFDDVMDKSLLVLEDLNQSKFQLKKTICSDFDHTKLFIIELGRLHAISFAMKYHKPNVFDEFKNMNDLFAQLMVTKQNGPMNRDFCELASSVFDNEDEKLLHDTIFQMKDRVWDEMAMVLDCGIAEPFAVVNHGDGWINNLLFTYENDKPQKIALLDFQLSRYASPVIDVIYFLFTCVDEEFRSQHYEYCLNLYYNTLLKSLVKYNITNPESLFPYSNFQQHLIQFGRIALGVCIFTLPLDLLENPTDATERKENKIKFQEYIRRMKGVVKDIQRYKYYF